MLSTRIPDGEVVQIPMLPGELGVTSLALTVLFTHLKDGKRAGDIAMLEGISTIVINVGPQNFLAAINSMMDKLDKLATAFEEKSNDQS